MNTLNVPLPSDLNPYIESILIDNICKTCIIDPYIVLPQPSLVLGFQYKGELNRLNNDTYEKLKYGGLSGLQTKYRMFKGSLETRNIIIKFHPWGAMAFFSASLYHFTNQALSLDNIVQQKIIETLEDQLFSAKTYEELINYLFAFLRNLINNRVLKQDPLKLKYIINLFNMHCGNQDLKLIKEKSGFSERTLERYFKEVLGLSPKTFFRLIRFQKSSKFLKQGLSAIEVLEKLNYYDQAHFINEFKSFSGLTPTQFINSTLNANLG